MTSGAPGGAIDTASKGLDATCPVAMIIINQGDKKKNMAAVIWCITATTKPTMNL